MNVKLPEMEYIGGDGFGSAIDGAFGKVFKFERPPSFAAGQEGNILEDSVLVGDVFASFPKAELASSGRERNRNSERILTTSG